MDFFELIRKGEYQAVKSAIATSPNLKSTVNHLGFPPMTLAAYNNQYEIVDLLISTGANLEQRDSAGNTALMGVSFKGYDSIADLLIEKGADINAENDNKATALIMCCMYEQVEMAKYLIKKGANVSLADKDGLKAKDYAKRTNNPELIALFK